ncbi:ketopantoate reductase PanE/ApbA C terminal-domain-containing protein [Phyllosticta paracitricarpa]|uniref:2-dehydropantoate 2-reductase n=1 Tax=Phyllosticta paracitricarpa TaxID=2016321 RepID=A0ABR1MYY4_9PEZI
MSPGGAASFRPETFPTSQYHVTSRRWNSYASSPTTIDTSTRLQDEPDDRRDAARRIYILGSGSVGKMLAFYLRTIPDPPPVTLLFHKPSILRKWNAAGKQITLQARGVTEKMDGFDVEMAMPKRREHGIEIDYEKDYMRTFIPPSTVEPGYLKTFVDVEYSAPRGLGAQSQEPINNLIVTVKAPATLSAISAVRHRLSRDSTIAFLQNGMGQTDEVSRELFPEEETRPSYIQGIISHGVSSPDPFVVNHNGTGTIQLGLMPRPDGIATPNPSPNVDHSIPMDKPSAWAKSARYILRTITRTPALCAIGLSPPDIQTAQLEKLAINCLVNPLTGLLDVRNGGLLSNYHLTRTMRLLLSEISLIIRSLPELQGLPSLNTRFAPDRLEAMTMRVASMTKHNVSSMLADVRRGNQTEIQYLNGYIVQRGEEMGVRAVMNYMVMTMIKGKTAVVEREREEEVGVLRPEDEVRHSSGE